MVQSQLHLPGMFHLILIFMLLNLMVLMFIGYKKKAIVDTWMLMIGQVMDQNIITRIVTLRQATILFLYIIMLILAINLKR